MSLFRVCVTRQLRCSLLHWSSPRTNLAEVTLMQKASIFSKKHLNENAKAMRFERRMQNLLAKKKKKHSFDAVSPAQLGKMAKPGSTATQTKHGKLMVCEERIKLKTYNALLHQSIDDIIAQDLEDLQVSILGVRLTGDLSTCRVYWQASGNYREDQRIQEALDAYAGKLRYTLINLRVLGRIPQIAFLQERSAARRAEVERLLEVADIPPDDLEETDVGVIEETQETLTEELEPVLGLDRAEINQQIARMKKLHRRLSDEESRREGSIDKFKSSIKRRKKGREKALYSHENEPLPDFTIARDDQLNKDYTSDHD